MSLREIKQDYLYIMYEEQQIEREEVIEKIEKEPEPASLPSEADSDKSKIIVSRPSSASRASFA